jgi:hypothetical protein
MQISHDNGKSKRLPNQVLKVDAAGFGMHGRSVVVPLLTAEARLKRALRYHLNQLGFKRTPEGSLLPPDSSKESCRHLHQAQRQQRLKKERSFILRQWP